MVWPYVHGLFGGLQPTARPAISLSSRTCTPSADLTALDNYQFQWFDAGGRPLRRAGYHLFWVWPRPVTSAEGFFVPTDAAIGDAGIIHVADSGNHRVVMLTPEGAYVSEWRIADADPNVYSPEHIATSPDGSTVYATDLAGHRVLVLSVATGS
jgi:hypothetical protein